MDIPKLVATLRYHYHINMLDVNNVLNQLGLRSDEKAEAAGKKHTMAAITDCLPRMGYDINSVFKKKDDEKKEES